MSVCVLFFKVIRIWKEEDVLLEKAFKATVSVNMAIRLSSVSPFKARVFLNSFYV